MILSHTQSKKREVLWLLGAVTTALILRCLFLTKESLWLDEIASWQFASRDLYWAFHAEATNPPLYYVLLHFWIQLFGTSEAALRSLSIFPGLGSVVLVYLIGRRLFSSPIALMAAWYLAICSFQVYYSQEARAFALLSFLVLVSTLLLIVGAETASAHARMGCFFGYAVVTALSLYTHFIAVFYFAAHGLYVVLRKPKIRAVITAWSVAASCALLAFLPWLRVMLHTASEGGQIRRYIWLKIPQAYFSFMFGDTLVPLDERAVRDISGTLKANAAILFLAAAATVMLFPFCVTALRRFRAGALLTLMMAVGPVLMAFAVSLHVPFFDERYLIASSPFVYLIVATGATEAFEQWQQRRDGLKVFVGTLGTALYTALVLYSLGNYYFGARFGREQWREAILVLETRAEQHDLVLFEPDYLKGCYQYYRRGHLLYWALTPQRAERIISREPSVLETLSSHLRVWLVRSHYEDDRLLDTLRQIFRESEHFVFPKAKGIEIYGFWTSGRRR
jgi:uncharacterized membrane protein